MGIMPLSSLPSHFSFVCAPHHPDGMTRRSAVAVLAGGIATQMHGALSAAEPAPDIPREPLVTLDGVDDHGVVSHLRYDGTTPMTIDTVVCPMSIERDQTIFGNLQSGGIGLHLKDERWEIVAHDGTQYVVARSDRPAIPKQRVRLTAMCDGTQLRLFVDGVMQEWVAPWRGRHKPSQRSFLIGADPDASDRPQHLFHGDVCALRFSGVVRDRGAHRAAWLQHPFDGVDDADFLILHRHDGKLIDRSRRRHLVRFRT